MIIKKIQCIAMTPLIKVLNRLRRVVSEAGFFNSNQKETSLATSRVYAISRKIYGALLHHYSARFRDNNKYDVLLIYPKSEFDGPFFAPAALLAIASPLTAKGYRVKIIDERIERDCWENVDQILKKGVLCVGFTFFTGNQIIHACRMMDLIKECYSQVPIVVGGWHATVLPEQTLQYANIDIVAPGEGEKTFTEIVEILKNNGELSQVRGILYKRDGEIIHTGIKESFDLNLYHNIDYRLIEDYLEYYPLAATFTSRGCPKRCTYCAIPLMYPRWRSFTVEHVFERIKAVLRKGKRFVFFLDENFLTDRQRVVKLIDLINESSLEFSWYALCRVDDLLEVSDEFMLKLKQSGLKRLYLGAESGSDRILNMVDKHITVEMIRQSNLRLKKINIFPEFTFMTGFPGETEEEAQATIDFTRELKRDNPDATIWKINDYAPYPGTELYNQMLKSGFSSPDKLQEWADFHWYRKAKEYSFNRKHY
ncbi:MAG: radical SAM protein [Candidatus Omnitrophota bacterium]